MKTSPSDVSALRSVLSRRELLRLCGLAGAATLLTGGRAMGAAADAGARIPGPGGQPGHYRFSIGSFDAMVLNDGGMAPSLGEGPFGVGVPREELAKVLDGAFLATDRTEIPFNVLLVRMGAELLLVDGGCGNVFGEAGGKLRARLAAVGVEPEQVTGVVITHAHGDHIGGLIDGETGGLVFKNAKHFINRREHEYWMGPSPDISAMKMPPAAAKEFLAGVRKLLGALDDSVELIAPGENLINGLELIDAPGHTPGHLVTLFTSGNESLFHIVDTVHHPVLSFAHPEWLLAFDSVPEQGAQTRRHILDRAAADRLRVFGAHLPFPSLGHVRTNRDRAFEYVMEPWSFL